MADERGEFLVSKDGLIRPVGKDLVVGVLSQEELEMIKEGVLQNISLDLEPRRVVLEVRPAAEHAISREALGEWVRMYLGTAAEIAGFRPGEVTHIRLRRAEGGTMRVVEFSVAELMEAMASEDSQAVKVDSERAERLREIEGAVRALKAGKERPDRMEGTRPIGITLDETEAFREGWSGGWDA